MNVTLPPLAGPAAQVWPLLFDLAADQPTGWVLAGSQMVIVHAAAHGISRPLVTEDADVLVDIRQLPTAEVASWLQQHGIELQDVSPEGIGHRFRRDQLTIDVLSIDHAGNSDRTTVPPARTIEVPGGRRAIDRIQPATITTAEGATGTIPVPDWLGAVLLKARAAVNVPDQRPKHTQDFALLLSLPINVPHWVDEPDPLEGFGQGEPPQPHRGVVGQRSRLLPESVAEEVPEWGVVEPEALLQAADGVLGDPRPAASRPAPDSTPHPCSRSVRRSVALPPRRSRPGPADPAAAPTTPPPPPA